MKYAQTSVYGSGKKNGEPIVRLCSNRMRFWKDDLPKLRHALDAAYAGRDPLDPFSCFTNGTHDLCDVGRYGEGRVRIRLRSGRPDIITEQFLPLALEAAKVTLGELNEVLERWGL